mgnify:FL=1
MIFLEFYSNQLHPHVHSFIGTIRFKPDPHEFARVNLDQNLMPYTITQVETTPNPNARKLIVDPSPGSIRSYFNSQDAQDDSLGRALFEIPQITNVLIHTQFISVCIKPGSSWKSVIKSVEKTLSLVD